MLQHGAYTLLLDACYDRERFPTLEDAIDWAWASTSEEIEAVKFVLSRFFTFRDGVYVQDRISEEIESYRQKALINKRIATEREALRRNSSTNRARTVHEAPPNQEPITNNQEPGTKEKTARIRALSPVCPDDVDEQTWADWLALRKSKRAPVTETVIRGARAESEKAQMSLQAFLRVWCTRGSQGLQADWLRPDERPSRAIPNRQEAIEARNQAAIDTWLASRRNSQQDPGVFDA